MKERDAALWKEAASELDHAIALAARCQYAELAEQAAKMQIPSSALRRWKEALEADPPRGPDAQVAGESLKRRVFVLGEVLRHANFVVASLLQIEDAARQAYNREGSFPASDRSRLNEEA